MGAQLLLGLARKRRRGGANVGGRRRMPLSFHCSSFRAATANYHGCIYILLGESANVKLTKVAELMLGLAGGGRMGGANVRG